jgi:hypothetical protein
MIHKTRSQRERERIEQYEYVRRMRESVELAENKTEREACELHPKWRPPRRIPGAPLPPPQLCPYCVRESRLEETGQDVWIRTEGSIAEAPALTSRAKGLIALYHESLERAGIVVPGSEHERKVLAEIGELREKEKDRRTSPGHLVAGRIEGGAYVEYRNLSPFGKAPRIVRIAP